MLKKNADAIPDYRDTGNGEARALQTLNVQAGDYRICIGERAIKEKTNEIPAAQEILTLVAGL